MKKYAWSRGEWQSKGMLPKCGILLGEKRKTE